MWPKFLFCMCVVITPKYGKNRKDFGILGVMAKYLYGYWSGHPCLVGVVGPNVARVSIIEAKKCTWINITCGVTINDELPSSHFQLCSGNDVEWHHIQLEPGILINLDNSGAKKNGMGAKCTKFLKFMSIIDHLCYLGCLHYIFMLNII